jgi:hypothetical protein
MAPITPRGILREMTAADLAVSAGVLLAGLASIALLPASGPPSTVRIFVDRTEVASLPLGRDAEVPVEGRIGPVLVEISGGAVRVARSGCANQICVGMGAKRRTGEVIACVPNAVIVRLEGGTPDADVPDTVSR